MKTQEALNGIIELFKNGDLPEAIKLSRFPAFIVPSMKYSYLNRLFIAFSKADQNDARGYRQWEQAKRHVKKGARAVYIFVPLFQKVKDEKSDTETKLLKSFKAVPVFRVQDTEGEPTDYQKIELPDYPAILLETAQKLNVSITAVSGLHSWYGAYNINTGTIKLASPDETVYFHELAHAVEHHLKETYEGGRDPKQEITAELTAAVISRLVGKEANYGSNWKYIKGYSNDKTPVSACLEVYDDVLKILNYIFGKEATNEKEEAPQVSDNHQTA
jgi:hypothetical protein